METLLLHPPLVHFAIVLPIMALIFQIAYSVSNNYLYSQWATRILVIAALFILSAWYTGGLEGQDVYPLLSEEGQATLKQHKEVGFYLMIGIIALAVLKFVACKSRNVILETVILVGLLVSSSVLAYQGFIGGDVVYKYGGGVENHSDGMDCLEEAAETENEEADEEDE